MATFFDPTTNRKTLKYFRKNLKFYLHKFIVCPKQWQLLKTKYKTLVWKNVPFKASSKPSVPGAEGLYFFTACPKIIKADFINYLFYIGESNNLQTRFQNYLDKIDNPKSSQYNMHTLIDDYPNNLFFYYIELPGSTEIQRKEIENEFLISFIPPKNGIYPKLIHKIVVDTYKN